MRRRGRFAIELVVAACLAAPLIANAAPVTPPTFVRQVVVFQRVAHDSSHLAVSYTNGTDGSMSAVVGIWGLDDPGKLTAAALAVTPGGYQAPETNATGATLGCSTLGTKPALLCESRVGGTTAGHLTLDTSKATDTRRLVMALVGDRRVLNVHLDAGARGWTMHRVSRVVRLIRTQDLQDTYVISAGESVEHFQEAHLPGGAHGSVVATAVPCRSAPSVEVAAGYGGATLDGATQPVRLQCPNGPITAFANTRKTTGWHLHGDVWGSTASGNQATSDVRDNTASPEDIRMLEVDGPF